MFNTYFLQKHKLEYIYYLIIKDSNGFINMQDVWN